MSHQQNITRIKVVFDALGELAKSVVFVGGATVSLYSTRPQKPATSLSGTLKFILF